MVLIIATGFSKFDHTSYLSSMPNAVEVESWESTP